MHVEDEWMTPAQLRHISPGQWVKPETLEQRAAPGPDPLDRRYLEALVYAFDNTTMRTVTERVQSATGLASPWSTIFFRVLLFDPMTNSLAPRKSTRTVLNVERFSHGAVQCASCWIRVPTWS